MGNQLVNDALNEIDLSELQRYKTPKEASALLNVEERTVVRWCHQQKITSIRIGGRWRVKI